MTADIPQLDLAAVARDCGVSVTEVLAAIQAGIAAGLLTVVLEDEERLVLEGKGS